VKPAAARCPPCRTSSSFLLANRSHDVETGNAAGARAAFLWPL
jgi:hypothetical protein